MTPTPPDAEAVARAERELDLAAAALSKGLSATMADSERYVNARNAYREAVERRVRGVCEWKRGDSPDDDIWYSGCGQEWIFNAGGPVENGCKFCHHCGGVVRLVATGGSDDGQ